MAIGGIVLISIVVIVALVTLFLIIKGEQMVDNKNRKAIDKFVSTEQGKILKRQLKAIEKPNYSHTLILLFSALNVYGIIHIAETGFKGNAFFMTYTSFSTGVHVLVFVIMLLLASEVFWDYRKSPRYKLPPLYEFMTDKEAQFLFWTVGKEDAYESDFLRRKTFFPQHLVQMFRDWGSLREHALLYDKLKKTIREPEHLSLEQRQRQHDMTAELWAKSKAFAPFYEDLFKATDGTPLDKKATEPKQESEESIPLTQEQLAEEIHRLGNCVPVTGEVETATTGETILLELKKVTESESVNTDMKKEATDLMAFIEAHLHVEKAEREREILHMDARTVIEASRIFYGITEQEVERKRTK